MLCGRALCVVLVAAVCAGFVGWEGARNPAHDELTCALLPFLWIGSLALALATALLVFSWARIVQLANQGLWLANTIAATLFAVASFLLLWDYATHAASSGSPGATWALVHRDAGRIQHALQMSWGAAQTACGALRVALGVLG